MDFEPAYTPEQRAFRTEVRAWLEDHVPQVDGDQDSDENYAKYRQLGRDLGAQGWLRPTAPLEYGGGGLSVDHAIVLAEEMDRHDLTSPPYYDSGGSLGGASILVWGSEEQKQRLLPPIFRGEHVTWQLLTGPEAGSDLASTETDAVRDGDEYVINGTKVFIGGSHGADSFWTIVRTDREGARHQNVSWFLIPSDLPGITVERMFLLSDGREGIGRGYKNTIYFDNVRVPAENLVGGEHNGWKVASTHLELEHGSGGRIARNVWFERTRERLQELTGNGAAPLESQDTRDLLAELFIETEVQRLFELRNFWMNRTHQDMSYEGPQASYYRKMSGLRVSQLLLELLGPYAFLSGGEFDPSGGRFDSYLRNAIVSLHPGGTADIQKVIMARRIGIGRGERERAGRTAE